MMYYVYIIQSQKDGKFYTGMTQNVAKRVAQHDVGRENTPSTKNRGPFSLIYVEQCENRIEARIREKYWKSGIGREKRDLMIKMVPVAQSAEREIVDLEVAGS